jgi:hypothetical protein
VIGADARSLAREGAGRGVVAQATVDGLQRLGGAAKGGLCNAAASSLPKGSSWPGCVARPVRTSGRSPGGCDMIAGRAGSGAALGASARDLVPLADARLIPQPNLYGLDVDCLQYGELGQRRRKFALFLRIRSSCGPIRSS